MDVLCTCIYRRKFFKETSKKGDAYDCIVCFKENVNHVQKERMRYKK